MSLSSCNRMTIKINKRCYDLIWCSRFKQIHNEEDDMMMTWGSHVINSWRGRWYDDDLRLTCYKFMTREIIWFDPRPTCYKYMTREIIWFDPRPTCYKYMTREIIGFDSRPTCYKFIQNMLFSPLEDNFFVFIIFAANSKPVVFWTHLRTIEKAPLK